MTKYEKNGTLFTNSIVQNQFEEEIKKITALIEHDYGSLDTSYSRILNFYNGQFPVTQVCEKNKTVKINLPDYVLNDSDPNALYQRKLQLAHEMVHTITPYEDTSKLTYLEEGLATVLSEKYTNYDSHPPYKYLEAKTAANELLAIDPSAITKLREANPKKTLSEFSEDMIKSICPAISSDLLQKLMKKFN